MNVATDARLKRARLSNIRRDHIMSTRGVLLIAMRIVGLVLIGKAIVTVPDVPYSALIWLTVRDMQAQDYQYITDEEGLTDNAMEALAATSGSRVLYSVITVAVCLGGGYYFLRHGKWIMRICLYDGMSSPTDTSDGDDQRGHADCSE